LHAGEGEEEEEDCAQEFGEGGDEVVEEGGWEEAVEEGVLVAEGVEFWFC